MNSNPGVTGSDFRQLGEMCLPISILEDFVAMPGAEAFERANDTCLPESQVPLS